MIFKIEYIYRGKRNTTQINGKTSAEAVENFKENYVGTISKTEGLKNKLKKD